MNLPDRNPNRTDRSAPDDLDQLMAAHLATGEELTPSSGFALSVMEAIESETAAPQPIPFPWRRVLPGLIALLCAGASFGIFALRNLQSLIVAAGPQQSVALSLTSGSQIHLTTLEQALCWIAASALLSFAALAASMRLAGARSTMRI